MAIVVDQPELIQLNRNSLSHSHSHSRLSASSKSTSTPVSPPIPENEKIDSKSIDDTVKYTHITSGNSAPINSTGPRLNNINFSNHSIDDDISVESANTVTSSLTTPSLNRRSSKKKTNKIVKPHSTRVTSKNKLDSKSKSNTSSSSSSSSSNKHNKSYRNLKNRSRSNKNDIEIHAKRRYKLDDGRIGICQFIGQTSFAKGIWVGIVIENDDGNTNGTVYGRKYFTCREGKGLFVRPNKIIEALERYIHNPYSIQPIIINRFQIKNIFLIIFCGDTFNHFCTIIASLFAL